MNKVVFMIDGWFMAENMPFAGCLVLHLIQQKTVMKPGYLCSSLLHNFRILPGRGKMPAYISSSGARGPAYRENQAGDRPKDDQ